MHIFIAVCGLLPVALILITQFARGNETNAKIRLLKNLTSPNLPHVVPKEDVNVPVTVKVDVFLKQIIDVVSSFTLIESQAYVIFSNVYCHVSAFQEPHNLNE